jgi:hypothetical protein
MLQPHPHDLRVAARSATYPNAQCESETLRGLDDAVFARVRAFEAQQVEHAQRVRAQVQASTTAIADLVARIRAEVRFPLTDSQTVDPGLAARYQAIRREAEGKIRTLGLLEQEAEWLQSQAADPYAAYCALVEHWPLIRPVITL